MFKRGGSTGGITANLKKPRQGFENAGTVQAPDFRQIMSQYMQAPEEPRGLTSSDYLRLAAAGAEIMGAQPTSDGSGFLAALSSAGPALSGAATDIASNISARKEKFRDRKSAYDAAMGQAAVDQATLDYQGQLEDYQAGRDQGFAMDLLDKEHELSLEILDQDAKNEIKKLIKEKDLSPYDFEKEFVTETGNQAIEDANAAISAFNAATTEAEKQKAIAEYKKIKNNFYNGLYGETTRANIEEKATLMADADFTKVVSRSVQAVIDNGENQDPTGPFYNTAEGRPMNSLEIQEKVVDNLFKMVISEVHFPQFPTGMAKGGRVGLARGGDPEFPDATPVGPPFEPGSGPNPDPGSPPIMATNPNMREGASSADIEMTFAELRRRLPPEVNDGVIKLIMSSEQAMIDFAQLVTPDDIATFNEKYNVDLQYPTQVA